MNTQLAEDIIGFVTMEPERLYMGHWIEAPHDTVGEVTPWHCGSSACLAGHAVLLTAPKDARLIRNGGASFDFLGLADGTVVTIEKAGREALELSEDITNILFYLEDSAAVPALKWLTGHPDATALEFDRECDANGWDRV